MAVPVRVNSSIVSASSSDTPAKGFLTMSMARAVLMPPCNLTKRVSVLS